MKLTYTIVFFAFGILYPKNLILLSQREHDDNLLELGATYSHLIPYHIILVYYQYHINDYFEDTRCLAILEYWEAGATAAKRPQAWRG